ncbi:MAG: hypothetical protein LIO77_05635, partial [Rikenellaceae bacterium]|nr:hypothetical protein [Rikenellaceae bacterium]
MSYLKRYIYSMLRISAVIFVAAWGSMACIREDIGGLSENTNVLVGLKMPVAYGNQIIDIKHEDEIETLDVLVFEKDGDFIELLHAEEYG